MAQKLAFPRAERASQPRHPVSVAFVHVHVQLRERNFDAGLSKRMVNTCVQIGNGIQPAVQVGQEAPQDKVQSAVAKFLKRRAGRRVAKGQRMLLGDLHQ